MDNNLKKAIKDEFLSRREAESGIKSQKILKRN